LQIVCDHFHGRIQEMQANSSVYFTFRIVARIRS